MIRMTSLAALAIACGLFSSALADENAAVSTKPAAPAAAAQPAAVPFAYIPKPTDVVYGRPTAPVTVVEYASLSCPHCSHFYTTVLPDFTKKYIDKGDVRLVFRSYPLNDPALKAAELVQCADPDRRQAFIKVLFSMQMKWAYDNNYRDSLANIAAMGGVERSAFEACMRDKKIEKAVAEVGKEAEDVYKVHSTPTFFIGSKMHDGPHDLESLSKDIDAALADSYKK